MEKEKDAILETAGELAEKDYKLFAYKTKDDTVEVVLRAVEREEVSNDGKVKEEFVNVDTLLPLIPDPNNGETYINSLTASYSSRYYSAWLATAERYGVLVSFQATMYVYSGPNVATSYRPTSVSLYPVYNGTVTLTKMSADYTCNGDMYYFPACYNTGFVPANRAQTDVHYHCTLNPVNNPIAGNTYTGSNPLYNKCINNGAEPANVVEIDLYYSNGQAHNSYHIVYP